MAKKILKEAVVRRFQKLANMSPINEMYMNEEEDAPMDDMPADDAPMADMDAPEGDMDDMGGEEAEVELAQSDLNAIAAAIPALESLVSAAGGAVGEEDAEMDDMDAPEGDMDDMGDEEEGEDLEGDIMEALRGISYQPSQSEIVNEVAQRVAKRLKAAKLHEAKLNRALGRK